VSHFLIYAARLQDAGVQKLWVRLDTAKDRTRLMHVSPALNGIEPETDMALVARFPERTFELCGTDRVLEQLQDDMAYSDDGPTPEKIAAACAAHPLQADDLREWYADWLLNPPLTDEEMADLPEVTDAQVDNTVQWVKGVMKGLGIARQRDAMKTPVPPVTEAEIDAAIRSQGCLRTDENRAVIRAELERARATGESHVRNA
jgi:hypothetical protein